MFSEIQIRIIAAKIPLRASSSCFLSRKNLYSSFRWEPQKQKSYFSRKIKETIKATEASRHSIFLNAYGSSANARVHSPSWLLYLRGRSANNSEAARDAISRQLIR